MSFDVANTETMCQALKMHKAGCGKQFATRDNMLGGTCRDQLLIGKEKHIGGKICRSNELPIHYVTRYLPGSLQVSNVQRWRLCACTIAHNDLVLNTRL